jgi:hypothetical protein
MQRFTQLVDQIGEARIKIGLKAALDDQVHSAVEIHAGLVEMAGFVLLLAFTEACLNLGDQNINCRSRIILKRG